MNATHHRRHSQKLLAALGGFGLASLGATHADASLLIDVRAIDSSNGGVVDSKHWNPGGLGDALTLGVYARVTGTDGINNETFNSVYGLLNSVGTLKGNLSGGAVTPFRDSSFQNGSILDWDSDGDLDIGMSPTHSGSTGKFFARNATSGGLPMQTIVNANSAESLIGQFVWTITATGDLSFDLNFTIRNNNGNNINGGGAALWFEDGQSTSKNTTNSPNMVGLPVVVGPEPSTLGLLGLASIGLLKRRRNR